MNLYDYCGIRIKSSDIARLRQLFNDNYIKMPNLKRGTIITDGLIYKLESELMLVSDFNENKYLVDDVIDHYIVVHYPNVKTSLFIGEQFDNIFSLQIRFKSNSFPISRKYFHERLMRYMLETSMIK